MPERIALPRYQGYFASRRWVWWRNTSKSTCPAFGLIDHARTYEGAFVSASGMTLRRGLPFAVESHQRVFFNGAEPSTLGLSTFYDQLNGSERWNGENFAANANIAVKPGGIGLATFDWPFLTLKHPDSPPIRVGERCSQKSGSWEVTRASQDETTEWVGVGPSVGEIHRYDSGRQFTCLGVQREPRIKDRDVLLIAPWRSPQADLLCAVKGADTQTVLTDDGDPFGGESTHYKFTDTFGLRVPSDPRSGDVYSESSEEFVGSKIRLIEPGVYDGVFQATIGMILNPAYAYSGRTLHSGRLKLAVHIEPGETATDLSSVGDVMPVKIIGNTEAYVGAEYWISFFDDIINSAGPGIGTGWAAFNEDRKRSVYLPFTVIVYQDAELSVRLTLSDPDNYTATVDNPSIMLEYIGPSFGRLPLQFL